MSMSLHVQGFKPPDDQWKKMKAVWDACEGAGLFPPPEVEGFFDGVDPDPAGVSVDLSPHLREWQDRHASMGYELDVADIPAGVKTIRFIASF
jgi:hypothetical protein